VIVLLNYFPILQGKIPFPSDQVLTHAAWDGIRPSPGPPTAGLADTVALFYPFRVATARAVRRGMFPLWNPYILSGAPLQAQPQSGLFYPLNLPYYILPVPAAWTIALLMRIFLAGFFMAMLVRTCGATTAGSIVSGITLALCGFMTAWQGHVI